MAQKLKKIAIFGPKKLQMTYNFDMWCILMIIIDFHLLFFLPKIAWFLGKKHPFLPTRQKFGKIVFDGKFMRFFKNGPIDPIYGINVP